MYHMGTPRIVGVAFWSVLMWSTSETCAPVYPLTPGSRRIRVILRSCISISHLADHALSSGIVAHPASSRPCTSHLRQIVCHEHPFCLITDT
jgi:hypothetical protein